MTNDIYRAANMLIKQHGDEAPIHAAMRHDELPNASDIGGAATWKRISRAVDVLLAPMFAAHEHFSLTAAIGGDEAPSAVRQTGGYDYG
ncbi:MAG: hypothetical protein H6905_09580 [Hyphomicrobiales bacterium]|nr:hypothetical protein [Hyphomicrobiales bacterium]